MLALECMNCRQPAFYFVQRPVYGQSICASSVRRLDGRQPSLSDPIECGSCGAPINVVLNFKDEYLRPADKSVTRYNREQS